MTQTAPSAHRIQAEREIDAAIKNHRGNRTNALLRLIAIDIRALLLSYHHVEGYREHR